MNALETLNVGRCGLAVVAGSLMRKLMDEARRDVPSSGAGKILYKGTVTPNIAISNGVTPRLTTATAITED